jgi:microcystin-dependent protein
MDDSLPISSLKQTYSLKGDEVFVVNQKNPIDNKIETRYTSLNQLIEYVKSEVKESLDEVMPVGSIKAYTGKVTDTEMLPGWLLCDGSSVSRTTYKKLYNVIGGTYGSQTSNTFKLPDLRGRTIIGYCNGTSPLNPKFGNWDGSDSITLGKTGGEFYHKLSESELPTHTHPNNHTHKYFNIANMNSLYLDFYEQKQFLNGRDIFGHQVVRTIALAPGPLARKAITESLDNNATFSPDVSAYVGDTGPAGGYTGPVGNSIPHNNMQPYVAINYLIKY